MWGAGCQCKAALPGMPLATLGNTFKKLSKIMVSERRVGGRGEVWPGHEIVCASSKTQGVGADLAENSN